MCKISKEYAYWEGARRWYFNWIRQELDYNHPRNLREKLMWLSRYWQDPRKTECADKYLVRDYIKKCGLESTLIPIYGVWENADAIDFDSLPDQFVLKCNHGSGYNIICRDKNTFDKAFAIKTLNSWLEETFGLDTYEIHYADIKPLIYCEQFLPSLDNSVIDYKIYCLNGKPCNMLVCSDRKEHEEPNLSTYSMDWERLDLLKETSESGKIVPKPKCLEKMYEIAAKLSEPFPFVRVDLYEIKGKVYFGEMTFTPKGNMLDDYKDEVLLEMGKKLTLPPKYKNKHFYYG